MSDRNVRSQAGELLAQARKLAERDRSGAAGIARAALAAAQEHAERGLEAEALNFLADSERMAGNMSSAQALAEQALSTAEAAGDDRAAGSAFNTLSALAWHRGEFDQAIEFSSRALKLREATNDERGIASTCGNLALLHTEKGDLARAMKYQQRCLALREKLGDHRGLGTSHLNLGVLYADLGDWDKALESYFRALAEKERAGDSAHVALCYNNIGELYLNRDKLDRARFYLEQALELVRTTPAKWILAEVLGTLGDVALAKGDLAEAQSCYEQDLAICEETEEREEQAETLRRLAELSLARAEYDESRRLLERSLALCIEAGARKEEGNVRRVLAELEARSGNLTVALALFEQSENLLRTLGRSFELGLTLLAMTRAGLPEPASERRAKLTEAQAIFDGLGVTRRAREAEHLLGQATTPALTADLLADLVGLACQGLPVADLASKALELACSRLNLAGAAIFMRDGRVFRHGAAAPGLSGVTFALETGGQRLGTLLLLGPVDVARTRAAVKLLSLGLAQAGAGPAKELPDTRTKTSFPGIIGADTTLRSVFKTIEQVAPTRANVLVLGESGTGKEIVARTIHELSDRRPGPFVAVNCAAIPEALLESELFGVERGTATGVSARIGRLEAADKGTLFLDEIGDMSLGLQAKLLRVLQERSFERVGGRTQVNVDIRVIAATNRNLEKAMAEARFRPDLFFRLNVITISLPPLRERRSDIPALVNLFLGRLSREYAKPVRGVTDECLACLVKAHWPGNVRELENVIERAVILARGELVTLADLPPAFQTADPGDGWREARAVASGSVEAAALLNALESSGWVVTKAAAKLGLSRRQMYRLMTRHGLSRPADT